MVNFKELNRIVIKQTQVKFVDWQKFRNLFKLLFKSNSNLD